MKYFLTGLAVSIAATGFVSLPQRIQAQESTTAKVSLTPSKLPNAIQMSVTNGVIDYVKSKKQVSVGLKWSLLPIGDILIKNAREFYQEGEPVNCSIRNENLGDPEKWIRDLSDKCQETLKDALMISDLRVLRTDQSDDPSLENFERFWTKNDKGLKLVFKSFSAPEYFSIIRDHLQLKGLLRSSGIAYSLDVNPEKSNSIPQGKFPRFSDKNITWDIDIYSFKKSKDTKIYRFVITAVVEPFNLVFPSNAESAKLDVGISFKKGEGSIGIVQKDLKAIVPDLNLKNFSSLENEKLQQTQNNSSDAELETVLSFLGGVNLRQAVSRNILGGSEDATIITGGLVSSSNVEPIIGVNMAIGDLGFSKAGVLVGVGYTNNNSLFVGPSLQYSLLTLSGGARFSQRNGSTVIDPAGVLSFDLSQLFGGRTLTQQITLDESSTGGDWGKASEAVAEKLVLVQFDTEKGTDDISINTLNKSFQLVKEGECGTSIGTTNDKTVEVKPLGYTINFNVSKEVGKKEILISSDFVQKLSFIPSGYYKFKDLDSLKSDDSKTTYELAIKFVGDETVYKPIDKDRLFRFCDRGAVNKVDVWTIRRKDDSKGKK